MTTTLETIKVAGTGALKNASSVTMINIRIERTFDAPMTTYSAQGTLHVDKSVQAVLSGNEHPVLVSIWDNDSDAIFDTL